MRYNRSGMLKICFSVGDQDLVTAEKKNEKSLQIVVWFSKWPTPWTDHMSVSDKIDELSSALALILSIKK